MRALPIALALMACKGKDGDGTTGTPETAVSVESLVSEEVGLGESEELTFDITNSGGGELEVFTVVISDGDRDVWSVAWDRAAGPLGADASLTVTVTFEPEEEDRTERGRVQVRTSDEALPTFFVPIEGRGAPSNADDDGDGVTVADGDCDDGNPDVYPGAPELCNGRDDDCDDEVPANEADNDGDGVRVCELDCDDDEPTVYPGAPEICDGLDSDCDGVNQDNADADADGESVCDGDCDDANPNVSTAGVEVCGDGLDNDCEGTVDVIDADGDGHNLCGIAADCDDGDATAFPRFVSAGGAAGAAGTEADPLDSVAEALTTLDATCRTVYVDTGTYGVSGIVWSAGDVRIVGLGAVRDDVIFDGGGARHLDLTGGTVTLEAVTLENGSGDVGGAVRVDNAELVAIDTHFSNNTATLDGGAIWGNAATVTLQGGSGFDGNSATNGGAIAMTAGSSLIGQGGRMSGNSATACGGAIYGLASPIRTANDGFEGNDADLGGAVCIDGEGGHLLQRATYFANTATTAGAALYVVNTTDGVFRNNEVRDSAGTGARIGGPFSVLNNTFTSNVTSGDGAAVEILDDGAVVRSNIAHFNDGLTGIHAPVGSLAVVTHNTVFATSSAVDFGGALAVDVDDNRSENPSFVAFTDDGDASNDDLGLAAGSPAIDTGPPEPAFNDTDGSVNDRGSTGGPGGL